MPAKRSKRSSARPSTEKTHSCDECGQAFRRKWDLERHRKLHSSNKDELKHKCPYPGCLHRTLQKGNLVTHFKASHLKLRPFKCEVDDCGQVFGDGGSLIRHEKRIHGYFRKEGEFRPVEPSPQRTRPQRSEARASPSNRMPTEEATMQFFDSQCASSSSSSPSSDSSFGFFTPSPSPDLPTPPASSQWEYPSLTAYPDLICLDNLLAFDQASPNSQSFDFFSEVGLPAPEYAPEFVQGCSGYSATPPPVPVASFGSLPSSLPDMASFGILPSCDVPGMGYVSDGANDEWSSLLPQPTLAESQFYSSAPVFPNSTFEANVFPQDNALNFSSVNNDFSQLMKELNAENVQL